MQQKESVSNKKKREEEGREGGKRMKGCRWRQDEGEKKGEGGKENIREREKCIKKREFGPR